jgi:hypothetical protein
MKTKSPNSDKLDAMIEQDMKRTEDRKLFLRELLQEAKDRNGFTLVHSSAMGRTLTKTGNPKVVPSYAATHTLEWIADKIKLGSKMPFMEHKIDEHGRLKVDADNAEEVKQRAPDWTRQPALAAYLAQSNRKFGPIIAVVNPAWVDNPKHENWDKNGRALKSATEFTPLDIEGRVGLLRLEGSLLYALDGQHRVIGIQGIQDVRDNGGLTLRDRQGNPKSGSAATITRDEFLAKFNLSIEELQSLLNETMIVEYLPAVIAGETRQEASRRIRNIFVAINSYAKKTDKGENILLDETDGYAIVARKVGLSHPLFDGQGKNNRVNWKGTTLPTKRTGWYTTLQAIREMAQKYLEGVDVGRANLWDDKFKDQMPIRPTEEELDKARSEFEEFLNHIFQLPVFQALERGDKSKRNDDLAKWRDFPTDKAPDNKGHLLLRPLGQMILAAAVSKLVKPRSAGGKGMKLDAVFQKLSHLDKQSGFEAHRPQSVWYGVTYDPLKNKMVMGNQTWAPDLLVYMVNGLDEPERQELWDNFRSARTVDHSKGTWRNLDGKVMPFDLGKQELPTPL